jgi:hypothetical protein
MSTTKKPKTKRGRKQDAKLVAAKQKSEVKYVAKKKKVSQKAVRKAVAEVGHSRKKVNAKLDQDKIK